MTFWIFAIALLAVPAVIISWPLFFGSTKDRINGALVLLIIPVAGLVLYQVIGTPEAIGLPEAKPQQTAQAEDPHSQQQGEMDDLVTQLQQRMAENPDDPNGWLILGRSLKTMKRYTEATNALANANRLAPGTPLIMVELAEARLFESGKPDITAETKQLLEAAIAIDPEQQKGLWLLGMAAAQEGDEARAITVWQKLLGLLDPASGAAESVSQQIEMAQTRLGQPVTEVAVAEFGIPVTVTIADELAGSIARNATLFVFIHPAGAAGMPLAVKRVAPTGFPLSLNFNDADLLRPGNSLENFEQLDISARISMTGTANKAPGDYQASLVTLDTKAVTAIALHLDQRVP
jgi:cytochrome c-type biogenesis protein CcmH